jgi:alkylhydroperoxidase family enzyme
LAVAKQDGLNESTIAEVDHYETSSLSERHKAALRYADALMTQPGSIRWYPY